MSKYVGVEIIDYLIDKFKKNPSLKNNLKQKLQQVTSQLYLDVQSATTFCHRFKIPHRLPDQLFQVYGVPYEKIKEGFKQLGFHTNRMYEDPYYQSLLILYLIGLYDNDEELRKIAIFLSLVKMYNGMMYNYFKNGCKENVAEYIKRAKLTGKSLLKTKTPLELLIYFIDTLDKKYSEEIKRDPKNMLVRLFAQTWGRLNQVFRNVAQVYYKHVNDKNVDEIVNALQTDEQGALKIEDHMLQSTIDILIDKFEKAISIKFPELPVTEKHFLMNKLTVTEKAVDMIYNYIKNHHEEIKYQISQFLMAVGVKSENDIHSLPIMHTVDKILLRKNETYTNNLKKLIDSSLEEIFGAQLIGKISLTQKLKLRKLYMYILFYLFQKVMSKRDKFERTLV